MIVNSASVKVCQVSLSRAIDEVGSGTGIDIDPSTVLSVISLNRTVDIGGITTVVKDCATLAGTIAFEDTIRDDAFICDRDVKCASLEL